MSALALMLGAALALAETPETRAEMALPPAGGDAEVIRTQTDRDRRMTVPVRIGTNDMFRFVKIGRAHV